MNFWGRVIGENNMNDRSKNPRYVKHRRWGVVQIYYLSNWFYKKGLKKIAYILKYINIIIFRVYIPPEVQIGKRLDLPHGGHGVVIHRDTVIGDDAIIFHNVTIANGGVIIGDRVYIGTGAVIIGPVTIGNDVAIGANAVVNFDVPDGAVVVGPLARIVKKR